MSESQQRPWDSRTLSEDEIRARRERTRAFLQDAEAVDEFMERVAAGEGVRSLCDSLKLAYATVQRHLSNDPRYDAALDQRAYAVMEGIEEIEQLVLADELDPKKADVLIKSMQFRLERLNPRRFGARQQIDVKHTDMTRLHLEAMRTLARAPRLIEATVVPELPAPTVRQDLEGIAQRYKPALDGLAGASDPIVPIGTIETIGTVVDTESSYDST